MPFDRSHLLQPRTTPTRDPAVPQVLVGTPCTPRSTADGYLPVSRRIQSDAWSTLLAWQRASSPRSSRRCTQHFRLELEILDDRDGNRSTIITSQLPIDRWHEHLGDPTLADAILDRVVHRAHRLALTGPSRRKTNGNGAARHTRALAPPDVRLLWRWKSRPVGRPPIPTDVQQLIAEMARSAHRHLEYTGTP
jgi:IstB-like ATP binding protein